jgi:hypothetical protein
LLTELSSARARSTTVARTLDGPMRSVGSHHRRTGCAPASEASRSRTLGFRIRYRRGCVRRSLLHEEQRAHLGPQRDRVPAEAGVRVGHQLHQADVESAKELRVDADRV